MARTPITFLPLVLSLSICPDVLLKLVGEVAPAEVVGRTSCTPALPSSCPSTHPVRLTRNTHAKLTRADTRDTRSHNLSLSSYLSSLSQLPVVSLATLHSPFYLSHTSFTKTARSPRRLTRTWLSIRRSHEECPALGCSPARRRCSRASVPACIARPTIHPSRPSSGAAPLRVHEARLPLCMPARGYRSRCSLPLTLSLSYSLSLCYLKTPMVFLRTFSPCSPWLSYMKLSHSTLTGKCATSHSYYYLVLLSFFYHRLRHVNANVTTIQHYPYLLSTTI